MGELDLLREGGGVERDIACKKKEGGCVRAGADEGCNARSRYCLCDLDRKT